MEKFDKFFDEGLRRTCTTENGATQLISTGSALVDQFGKAGNYRGRHIEEVFSEQAKIWGENPEMALRFPFYLRMVTRKIKVGNGNTTEKPQNGQGARDEAFKRLLWIAKNHQADFDNNIFLLPLVGSWKDIWTMMFYDKMNGINAINHELMFDLLMNGLKSDVHVDLVKKFMPRIKSSSKCTTDWTKETNAYAKEFAKFMGVSYSEYNKLKSSGKAHDFQKIICARKYDKLEWNKIPGRALHILVKGKFLENHGLRDSYVRWIMEQPTAKFTGYVFELAKTIREKCGVIGGNYWRDKSSNIPIEIKHTVDSQFNQLVENALGSGKITENVLCCLDTSGSMCSLVNGLNNVSCLDVATSLAVFFAKINKGAFHNSIISFDSTSKLFELPSNSFCENIDSLPSCGYGGTNFLSVIDTLIDIRKKKPNIPLEEYPTTLLAVSDMEFNRPSYYGATSLETNNDAARKKLLTVFPKNFVDKVRFVWWNVASRHGTKGFESTADDNGSMFLSGFDGSIMAMLLGEDNVVDKESGEVRRPSAEDIVKIALSQEIFTYLELAEKTK